MRPDVAVIGGGVIGLASAWRCAQLGMRVTVLDPDPGGGASTVAAGMLAPVSETYFHEPELTALLVASATQWPRFADELSKFGDVGYRTDGTLVTALTTDDLAMASRLWRYQASLGLPVEELSPEEMRVAVPGLHPRVRRGARIGDHQADPRRLMPVLRTAAEAAGVELVARRVGTLDEVDAGTVVVAAGTASAGLGGLPVRPVKGQVLRLRAHDGEPGFRHVIRGYADGRRVYLVPRPDGEVVVGATEEERTDDIPTAGGTLDLLRAATDLVPELSEYELTEVSVGHRPGTPDNAPIMGMLRPGVVVATGHYRHGILLAPLTADAVAQLVATGVAPEVVVPFGPSRFRVSVRPTGMAKEPR
jgi:glycine oxidase